MKRLFLSIILPGCLVVTAFCQTGVHSLTCNQLSDPPAIEPGTPRLGWQISSSERGEVQTAYQVLVTGDSLQLKQDKADSWNSGKVLSGNSQLVNYGGKVLAPGKEYYWKVRIWNKKGKPSPWSKTAMWRTGLRYPQDWQAHWITASRHTDDTTDRFAAIQFRKPAYLRGKPVKAIAWLCGLGFSELYINGNKIGNDLMNPSWTDYGKRALYNTWDVTDHFKAGENVIGVLLGNGWFNLATPDLFGYEKAPWHGQPRFLLRVALTYADGGTEMVVSDGLWKWRESEITFNCIRGGETVDARRILPGWASVVGDEDQWQSTKIADSPNGVLLPQHTPGEQVTHLIKPVKITSPKPGVYVYDLGSHIAGFVRFKTSGRAGQEIVLDFDEDVNEDGTITKKSRASHTYGRYQVGKLILSGKGEDVFEPRFTYHGFRYIQVRGLSSPPTLNDLTGLRVYNNVEDGGSFTSSNDLLNRVQQAYRYSMLNAFHGVMTEPAREKINWTQDAHNMIEGAIYNFQFNAFANKWLDDVLDSQLPNGFVPSINPNGGWGHAETGRQPPPYSDPWWGGVILEIPWIIYKYYGDSGALIRSYEPMKAYVDFLSTTASDNYFLTWGIGDWLEVGAEHKGFPDRTPLIQTSTTAYFYYAKLLSEIAALLGHKDDAGRYALLAQHIREAFNHKFLKGTTGLYADDSQTSQILPLYLGLAPDSKRDVILQRLLENIKQRNGHISAGFVGYLYLIYGLTELGYANTVYEMATQTEYPGWGFMLKDGGTNLWESWNGIAYNFPSLGGVGNWYYQALAGISPDKKNPGFKNIILKPNITGDLQWVKGEHNGPYGKISSEWKREKNKLLWTFSIPANSGADVYVPARDVHQIWESGRPLTYAKGIRTIEAKGNYVKLQSGSGTYHLEVRNK